MAIGGRPSDAATMVSALPSASEETRPSDPFAERPFLVFWEITRACALACQHCRAEAQPRRDPRELSTGEAFKVVDQLAAMRPPMLVLTGGDPLMRRDVLQVARRASDQCMRVALSPAATNRLMHYDFHALREAGITRMSLSLDGATRETHDRFRGVPGTFDRTIAAVRMAEKAGISLQINTTLAASNLHEFPQFRDLMMELRPEMWSVFILVPTGRAGMADVPDGEALEEIFRQMAELAGTVPFGIKTTEGHHYRRVLHQSGKGGAKGRQGMRTPEGIRDGRGVMFISHVGEVSPSGFLPLVCGNVRDTDPSVIYRYHPLFVSLRDSDALGGKCSRCEFRKICGGSRARAYGATGDPFAADPSCIYQPKQRP